MDRETKHRFVELVALAEELRCLGRRETCLASELEPEAARLHAEALRLAQAERHPCEASDP